MNFKTICQADVRLMFIGRLNKESCGPEADWVAQWNQDVIKDFLKIIHKRG